MGLRTDLRIELASIVERWPTTAEQRAGLVAKAMLIANTSKSARTALAAMKILIAMEAQNQKDQADEINEIRDKLVAIANLYKSGGIDHAESNRGGTALTVEGE